MNIDVSNHHSPSTGKLYMPSQPWGINWKAANGATGGDHAKTRSEALERAQRHVVGKPGASAEVFRRKDGKVAIRYWFDDRLQYIEY